MIRAMAVVTKPSTNTAILIRELYLARVQARLEQETDHAFLAWSATKHDLPGHKWEHVTDPLLRRWQDMEQALALVRCL
jgi:hypothetical protein